MLQTAVYYLSFLVVGMTTASFGPSLPGFAANTGSTLAGVGALFVFHRIGYITGSLGGGRVVDRLRGNLVTGSVLIVIAGGLAAVAFAGNLFLLLGSILVLGLAQGTAEVGANTGVVRLHGSKAGPYMNGLHLSFGIGAMAAPLVISLSAGGTGSIRAGYWFLAALAAAAGLWMLKLPDAGKGQEKERAETSRGSRGAVVFIAALLFFTIAGEAGFAGWVYSYALKKSFSGEAGAGLLTSGFWTALTVGRFIGIGLVRRLGPRGLLLTNVPGAFLAAGLFFMFPDSFPVLWVCAVLLGFFQASIIPAAFTLAGDLRVLSGSVAGIFIAASSLGGMSFPWLVGRFFESSGGSVFPLLIAVSQAAALASLAGVLAAASRKAAKQQ
jgi:FHS family Na+ dependent glucose MFS transporter 1